MSSQGKRATASLARAPTISRENENHLIDEICSVLSTFGIDMTKSEFRKMTENEFLNILNICVFCNDAYSVEWLKKNPQKVLNFFTDSDFRYKIDQKMLRTITMPHNNKLKIQVCHHICSMALDCLDDNNDLRYYDMENLDKCGEYTEDIPMTNILMRGFHENFNEFSKSQDWEFEDVVNLILSKDIGGFGREFMMKICPKLVQMEEDKNDRQIDEWESLRANDEKLSAELAEKEKKQEDLQKYVKLLQSGNINQLESFDAVLAKCKNFELKIGESENQYLNLEELETKFDATMNIYKNLNDRIDVINLADKSKTITKMEESLKILVHEKFECMRNLNDKNEKVNSVDKENQNIVTKTMANLDEFEQKKQLVNAKTLQLAQDKEQLNDLYHKINKDQQSMKDSNEEIKAKASKCAEERYALTEIVDNQEKRINADYQKWLDRFIN